MTSISLLMKQIQYLYGKTPCHEENKVSMVLVYYHVAQKGLQKSRPYTFL